MTARSGKGGWTVPIVFYGYVIFALLAICLYLPRIFGYRYAFRKPPKRVAAKKRNIAVLIPARGESAIIGDLFDSLEKQDYDRGCFQAFVIVKDRDDPTVAMAKSRGFSVTVVEDQRCKGDALDGFFRTLSPDMVSSFDAFVIVDADGVLSPSYLFELNNALEEDAEIFVTRKLAKNFLGGKKDRSLFSNCAALTWPMIDELGNAYRTAKNMPLNLCGQGLMVKREIIETLGGWPYHSMTEDYELKLDGILHGFRSAYYPDAVLYTEEATGRRENFTRRVRWLAGYRENDKNYKGRIKEQAKDAGKLNAGEREYFFGIVPYLIYLAATVICSIAGVVFTLVYATQGDPRWLESLLLLVVFPQAMLYFLLFAYTIIALLCSRDAFRMISLGERVAMVLYNPFYILEYLRAYLVGMSLSRKKALEWKQTERVMKGGNGDAS